jgi:hypothetical protein
LTLSAWNVDIRAPGTTFSVPAPDLSFLAGVSGAAQILSDITGMCKVH